MNSCIRVLTVRPELPLYLPWKLALASVAMFPECYEFDEASGIASVDCSCLTKSWRGFVNTDEFNKSVKSALSLLDGFNPLRKLRASKCGRDMLQDMVKEVIEKKGVYEILEDLQKVAISMDSNSLEITWGDKQDISHKLIPQIFKSSEYMEASRTFLPRQLAVTKKGILSGCERRISISCEVYAAMIIGVAATIIGKYVIGKYVVDKYDNVHYYFFVPNTLHRDLCAHIKINVPKLRNIIARLTTSKKEKVGMTDIEEHLLYLLLYSAIRAPTGSATFYVLDGEARVQYEISVDYENLRIFGEALDYVDPNNYMPIFITNVVEMIKSKDEALERVGRILSDVLRRVLMIAMSIGDASANAFEALRLLSDRAIVKASEDPAYGGAVGWALDKLPLLVEDMLKSLEAVV